MDVEVRPLKTDDIFRLSRMMLGATEDIEEDIVEIVRAADKKERSEEEEMLVGIRVARLVLEKCLVYAEDDLKEWLGDLCGMTAEEFGEAPLDTPLAVIEQLAQEDLKSFFGRAYRVLSRMSAAGS